MVIIWFSCTGGHLVQWREIDCEMMVGIIFSEMILFCFVCFVALRPKSTAMVMAGRSVHLNTFSWASLNK